MPCARRLSASSQVVAAQAAVLDHRRTEAIRIVQSLKGGLAACAQRAVIDRVVGIPLELDHAAVARLGDQAACGGALATRGRVVRRDARDRLIRRHEVRNELAGFLGASRRTERGAGGAEHLEELAALDAFLGSVRAHVSSGSWRSRSAPSCARPRPVPPGLPTRWPAWLAAVPNSPQPPRLPSGCSRSRDSSRTSPC